MWWALQAAGGNFSGNAEKIKNCLLSEYWDNAAGRFKGGRNNEQIFLDAQTWGAAFLKAIGENEKALQALSYAREVLREPAQGGQLFGFDGNAGPWSVWNEGTAQYIAVGGDGAGEVLPELLAQQEDGAMVGSPDEFSGGGVWTTRWHGVAPTAWLYNALCGEPFHPGSQPRCTAGVGEPSISSILRVDLNPTSATTVNFEVTFSEPVTNVDLSDFTLTTTGVKGATITSVVCSGAACTVTVNTGSIGESNGKIRLDVLDDDSIVNGGGDPLGGAGTGNGDFSWGDIYTIAAHVSVPVLLAPPKNRPVTNNSKPDFAWSAVTDADHYEIQFATNDAFTQSVDSQLVGDLSFTITNSLADGKYYWRVRAYNILNEAGSWSVSNY
ncbi:MAG TPA: hypothetical protein VK249_15995, partial [Anaerolineales bacterium]|nr:hypothetical protein [Anaerolineales bacterium]